MGDGFTLSGHAAVDAYHAMSLKKKSKVCHPHRPPVYADSRRTYQEPTMLQIKPPSIPSTAVILCQLQQHGDGERVQPNMPNLSIFCSKNFLHEGIFNETSQVSVLQNFLLFTCDIPMGHNSGNNRDNVHTYIATSHSEIAQFAMLCKANRKHKFSLKNIETTHMQQNYALRLNAHELQSHESRFPVPKTDPPLQGLLCNSRPTTSSGRRFLQRHWVGDSFMGDGLC